MKLIFAGIAMLLALVSMAHGQGLGEFVSNILSQIDQADAYSSVISRITSKYTTIAPTATSYPSSEIISVISSLLSQSLISISTVPLPTSIDYTTTVQSTILESNAAVQSISHSLLAIMIAFCASLALFQAI